MTYNISVTKTQHSRLSEVDFDNLPFGKIFTDHMFIVDYENGQWHEPRVVPFANLDLHPAAMALHYGQAIFEGMKAFKTAAGEPVFFRPEQHAIRINKSAERLCMPTLPEELFDEAVHTLVGIDKGWIPQDASSSLYLRPFMIATEAHIGVRAATKYSFYIIGCPVGPYYPKPVSLYAEQKYVRAVNGGSGESKAAGNYAASLLPAKEANDKGFDQVMWMDGHEFKYVQEVGTMNIFFVLDDKIVTPATTGSILKGITRDSIITILRDKGYTVEEKAVNIDDLIEAYEAGRLKEVFGSGTAAVISHVSKIQYKDKLMVLPAVEDREVGPMAKQAIEDIRRGVVADKFSWVKPVRVLEAVEA